MFSTRHRAKFAVFGAMIASAFIVFQGVSEAHHPEISARAACISTNTARIALDLVAWQNDDPNRRFNSDIQVTIAGQTLHGAFTPANNYSFTLTVDVPANGATYTATAVAKEPWGPNGEFESPDNYREATVTVPESCPGPTTTTLTPTTTIPRTTTVIPTTTVASTSSTTSTINPTTTTAPPTTAAVTVSVQGVVETAPTTTVAGTAVQGVVLARTGTNTMLFVIGGVVLVLLGSAVELSARRRRSA